MEASNRHSGSHHSPPAATWRQSIKASSRTASHHGLLLLLPFSHHRRAPPPPTPPRPDPPSPTQIRCHTARSPTIQPSLGLPELLPPYPAADAASSFLISGHPTPAAHQGVAIRMLQGCPKRPRRRLSSKSDALHWISRRADALTRPSALPLRRRLENHAWITNDNPFHFNSAPNPFSIFSQESKEWKMDANQAKLGVHVWPNHNSFALLLCVHIEKCLKVARLSLN
jgi:hypothetical protein